MQIQTHEGFFVDSKALRAEFDARFGDPLAPRPDRFVWDYWHVPGEYTLLRTQAHRFFSPRLYARFHRRLVEWGRAALGCHDVSPPWLSCYVEGCRQERHQDVPHGPLAFVYSLTPTRRRFRGGETFIAGARDVEPRFNRLLVFNPALPHGVRTVRGTFDPRHGRLVIHGWFVNPRPFWYGPLRPLDVRDAIESGLSTALGGGLNLGHGFFSCRLSIGRDGKVARTKILANTLKGGRPRDFNRLCSEIESLRFKPKRAATELTLPLTLSD